MAVDLRSRRLAAAWALSVLVGVACSSRDAITTPHTAHRDLAYADASDRNVLDVYVPKSRTSAVPVVLWIHGGAFRVGDKSRPAARGRHGRRRIFEGEGIGARDRP